MQRHTMTLSRGCLIAFAAPFVLFNAGFLGWVYQVRESPPEQDGNTPATTAVSPLSTAVDAQTKSQNSPRFDLRVDWSNLGFQSPLAQRVELVQNDCNPTKFYVLRENDGGGLGSNLISYSDYICTAMKNNATALFRGDFRWIRGAHPECDAAFARAQTNGSYAHNYLDCYFPKETCAAPPTLPVHHRDPRVAKDRPFADRKKCDRWLHDQKIPPRNFHAATMEWLFARVSDLVIEEARRQVREAFGEDGLPHPEDLVTIHIRWGDKARIMKLKPISQYISSIHEMVGPRANRTDRPLHIYVASEDTRALRAFGRKKPAHWITHSSGPSYNGAVHMPGTASGTAGLQSMGALLVSMEANYYVVSTFSYWSRLINSLRMSVVDSRCDSCTRVRNLGFNKY